MSRRGTRRTGRVLRAAAAAAAAIAISVAGLSGSASANNGHPGHGIKKHAAEPVSRCKLPATDVDLSEGWGSTESFAPSTGTVKAKMIFVDFPDAPANDSTTALYNELAPGATSWFKTASYGKLNLDVTADTSHFYRMPAASDSYGYQRGLTSAAHRKYIQDALNAVGRSVDFKGTQLLYVVATRAAPAISFSPTYMSSVTAADGTVIGHTVTFGQDLWTWGSKVVNHETGHTMGLPDLYPFTGVTTQYVGGWDLMGLISGPSPDRFAWHKWKQNWINDSQVDCVTVPGTTSHTLTPIETASGSKMTVIKTSDTRAVVAEVRSDKGVDSATCATGVLVYTVDTSVTTGSGPIVVQDARPDSGGCDGAELNDATFGYGSGQVSVFHDAVSGASITVTGHHGDNYTISVTK
jgi:M6 family metalloprotease-like protein